MRLGLVSDTHDRLDLATVAARAFSEMRVERVLHLGDITRPETAVAFQGLPVTFLRGNNDFPGALDEGMQRAGFAPPEDAWEGELAGVRVGATHGHRSPILRDLVSRCDLVCRGHSHRAGVERVQDARVVNPGALHRAPVKTICVVELPSLDVDFFEVRTDGISQFTL